MESGQPVNIYVSVAKQTAELETNQNFQITDYFEICLIFLQVTLIIRCMRPFCVASLFAQNTICALCFVSAKILSFVLIYIQSYV